MTDSFFGGNQMTTETTPTVEETPEEQAAREAEEAKIEALKAEQKEKYDAMEEARDGRNIDDIPLSDGYWTALQEFQTVARKKSLNFSPPPEAAEQPAS